MSTDRPAQFPSLPDPISSDGWSSGVLQAHEILTKAYHDSHSLLRFEDGDPIRLQLHSERLKKRIVPILQALEEEVSNPSWIAECTHALASLICELDGAAVRESSMSVLH